MQTELTDVLKVILTLHILLNVKSTLDRLYLGHLYFYKSRNMKD